ncbi:hypothetical protein MRX96_039740 [Rhipicephalus microplus]
MTFPINPLKFTTLRMAVPEAPGLAIRNCYCLNCHGQEQHNASIFNYHTVSAPNAGLTLTLDVQPQEYLPTSTAMGFLVMVHGRGFRADACAESVFAQPGYITYIGLIQDGRIVARERNEFLRGGVGRCSARIPSSYPIRCLIPLQSLVARSPYNPMPNSE